tara:strand:- start:1629 stop:1829 length:201 start_codon:yes stop_codon:yes gene_type:complete
MIAELQPLEKTVWVKLRKGLREILKLSKIRLIAKMGSGIALQKIKNKQWTMEHSFYHLAAHFCCEY